SHDPDRREPSAGAADRYAGLDGAGRAGGKDPAEETEERRGPAAAFASAARRDRADGHPQDDLSRDRGSDPVLRARAVSVRPDRDRVDAGLHDDPGLRRADGRGRNQADQRIRGGAGGGEEAGRSEGDRGGHDGAGSECAVPERDGIDGELSAVGDVGWPAGGPGIEELSDQGQRQIQSGQAEAARLPPRREEQDQEGEGPNGGADGRGGRRDPQSAGTSDPTRERGHDAARGLRPGRSTEAGGDARHDDEAAAADPLLAADRLRG